MSKIHKTAIIDKLAQLDEDVSIGPYSIIGPNVKIGSGTIIEPHVVIDGHTTIGKNNHIYQFSSLGAIPQDKKYKGEDTELIIGDNNTIRESCTINLGTVTGIGKTVIGNNNWIMAYVHIAHDCIVGNNTIFANNTSLAGHVIVKDYVVFGGFSLIYQFCIIGEYAMTAFATGVHKNIPPYVMAYGFRAKPSGINSEGLRRNNFTKEQIFNIKQAYKILYRNDLSFDEAVKRIKFMSKSNPELKNMVSFLDKIEQRGIIR